MSKLKRKYQHFALEENYLDICKKINKIDLVIMGKDPFPKDAMGIPFCKKNWRLLSNKGESGFRILNSLNYKNFDINNYLNDKCILTPQEYFIKLAKKGIIMLNASYYFLERETISRKRHFDFVYSSLEVNFPIIKKAENIILCGDAYELMNWVVDGLSKNKFKVPHPSMQSHNNKNTDNDEWDKYWGEGKLKAKYDLF